MLTLPEGIIPSDVLTLLAAFAPLFTGRTFAHAQVLCVGAILTPGRRTVTAALRAMGLAQEKHFQNYHRVLNRAHWSSRKAAQVLLELLVKTFVSEGPLVMGMDETLERRRGAKIAAKGIYGGAGPRLPPKASTAMPSVLAAVSLPKAAACAGSA